MRWPSKQRAIIYVAATLICAGPALSQANPATGAPTQTDAPPPPPPGGPPRGGPERRVDMLQRALNLSPDQTTQVRAIFDAERTRMEALRSNTALSPEDRRSQMMAIHQDTNAKMHALLSPEQTTKYDAIEARMRERRPQGGNPPPPPPPGPGQG